MTIPNPPAEEARLDQAFSRADELLVASLKTDESRRRRRFAIFISLTFGVLIMTTVIALILSGLLGGNGQPAAANSTAAELDKAAALSQQGWQLWANHNPAEAETKFQEAVKIDPSLTAAWNGLGWSETNQGKVDDAEKAFDKVIALEPGHAAAENGLGWICYGRHQFDKAEQHWLKSAETPNASAAWNGLTRLYLGQKKWDDAAKWAQKLVDSGDTTAQPLLDAAKVQKTPPDVLAEFATAPTNANPSAGDLQRGWALLNKGSTHQAIEVFTDMLKKNPNDADAHNGMGWALLRTGQSAQAKYHFQAAVKANPEAAGSINGLAMCLKNEGKVDEAIVLWKQMAEKFPGVNAATSNLAATYLERKDFAAALPYCEQLATAMPDDQQVQQQLAMARAGAAK